MAKQISTLWIKHLSEDKKEDFKAAVLNSRTALERLSQILDEMIEACDTDQANFDDPNWTYRQASLIGEKKALKRIKRLLPY